ncbi:MAG: hypothetical protein VYD64_05855 [Pseudomonadota bacterium]|nr:hypothetical protein [Pseudomonadota bacterium]
MISRKPADRFFPFTRRAGRQVAILALSAALVLPLAPAASAKTYLVNGVLSATAIGYGFKNLKKKIPGATLFNNMIGGEGTIRRTIIQDIRRRFAANPNEQFTLAGISSGANVILEVAEEVAKDGIPIFYLGIVESSGGTLPGNVQNADNFVCAKSGPLCTKAVVRGANTIQINTGHIDMGNHPTVHNRVVSMAR